MIFKIDLYKVESLTPLLEYENEIYDIKNKAPIELYICKGNKIEVLLPYEIEE